MGIDKNMPAGQVKRGLLKRFVFSHADLIRRHNEENVAAARQYYGEAIGGAKNILVVDIGWTGTCITALKYFLETHLPETECEVFGTLMCTTRGKTLTTYMEKGVISSYIYSPCHNMELADFMLADDLSQEELDYRHLSLEYLFTSAVGTLIGYRLNDDGQVEFERSAAGPKNAQEILEMQEGMLAFVQKYQAYKAASGQDIVTSPYVAFGPLMEACRDREYMKRVYCRFAHDSSWKPYVKNAEQKTFGECFT